MRAGRPESVSLRLAGAHARLYALLLVEVVEGATGGSGGGSRGSAEREWRLGARGPRRSKPPAGF